MTNFLRGGFNRRRFMQTTAAAGIAASLPFGGASAAPKKGGTMKMGQAHGGSSDTLDPGLSENGFTLSLLFGLHGYMTEIGTDGSVQPGVAESWSASADASSWTFKLRKGVTFHDGRTLTAQDVVNSINHHRGEKSTSAAGPIVKAIQDIRIDDPSTITFVLDGGNADFPFVLSDYHLAIGPSKDDKLDWKSGIGCGCYKLDNFEPGVRADFSRFDGHWADDRGWFDSIELLSLVDLNARTTALVSGEVHAADRLDLKTTGLLGRKPGVNIHSIPGTQHYTFAMDCRAAPFNDVNVRRALKYAVNREELVEKILFGYGSVGNDVPIGRGQRFFNSEMPQTSYDPDKAKYYLKQAGMDSLSVSLSAADAAFAGAVDATVLYQNSAKAAGIDLTPVREPNDGYWSDVWMKKPFCAVYWGGRPIEDLMFSTAYQTGVAWNDSYWSDKRFDELLVKARAELDEAKRREMYYEMQLILNQDGGVIIPMFASYVFATTDAIGHDAFGSNWDLDGSRWMERWWFA
ncbi:MAG: ABC transporter substrate-binding protein [Thalassobaculaceae bacterium]|nr:ABC transporter substrate-binding protein [Thalassobaculaceae bacterium]